MFDPDTGAFSGTPGQDDVGELTVKVTATDPSGDTAVQTFTLTIGATNNAPVVSAIDAGAVAENAEAQTIDLLAGQTDPENDTLSAINITVVDENNAPVQFTDKGDGAITIDPAQFADALNDGDTRNVTVSYDVSDGTNTTPNTATLDVTGLTPVPHNARINEFHYDNAGADEGEFIEIRVDAGADASALVVELYNGSNGTVYGTLNLSDLTATTDGTYDYYVLSPASIQNGAPDGIALSDGDGLIEFISYEGTFQGVGGAADGVTSTDVGVAQSGSDPIGSSLQLQEDGSWALTEGTNTQGAVNAAPPVPHNARINEFHYDNAGADEGEFIEIRVDAGADASALVVELYNGSNGTVYNTLNLSDLTATTDGTYDYYVLSPASIQNGAPDGVALSDGDGLIEFISYEGTFQGVGGAADGVTSTDVGVAQSGSDPIGSSLQLQEDGSWALTEGTNTQGAVNAAPPVPHNARINEFHYDNAGADEGEFIEIRVDAGADASALVVELYNGSNGTVYGTLNLSDLTATTDGTYDYYVLSPTSIQNGAPDGIALSDGDGLIEFISYEGTFQGVGGAADGVTSTDVGVAQSGSDPIGSSLQLQEDGSWALTEGTNTQGAVNAAPPVPHNARINEFHYDNAGADEGEFIEIRVDAGADASALVVELYNGSNGTVYGTLNLSDLTATTDGTYDYYVLSPASIQNGAPDGIALSDGDGLIEFISYEGTLQGVGGAADGVTSTDVGVAQSGSDPIGSSLQLQEDGSWALTEGTNTQGAVNAAPPVPHNARINEFHYDNAGGDVGEFIEIRVDAGADASALVVELYNGSNGTVYNTLNLSDLTATTDGTYDYYVFELPANGLQNGAPDGIALIRRRRSDRVHLLRGNPPGRRRCGGRRDIHRCRRHAKRFHFNR